ncbi:MAG: DUF3656 domain-containing protein, partial [Oscillospiraceae bacterium]|nr:DUF3656 domain-containing protein [Oscillospiraceae bacterium]
MCYNTCIVRIVCILLAVRVRDRFARAALARRTIDGEFGRMLELLSPAGSLDALHAAVCNGADAVYFGVDAFNARRGARNFTIEELPEAVRYCHVRGVQVHLTLNTLVTDREMPKLAELITAAARAGVDAFIVQDLGVVALCKQIAPQISLHASTQMSIHSLEGVRQAAQLGLSRVVLARELPREDIAFICRNSPIEIEVFVHGALCMSHSGQCYMSCAIGSCSANRGQCKQPCRLPYGYGRFEETYPLSLKDNCLVQHLPALESMGVKSVKIEGRMKRPEYVATVTRIYRAALGARSVTGAQLAQLETIFSRQGFTQDYYFGKTGAQMFGVHRPANGAKALMQTARASYENIEPPLVPVKFYALVSAGQDMMLAVQDNDGNICKAQCAPAQAATNRQTTAEDLAARLSKTGGTPFYCESVRSHIDPGLRVSAASLNRLRREVLAHLTAVRGRRTAPEIGAYSEQQRHSNTKTPPVLTICVREAAQITPAMLRLRPAVLYVGLSEIAAQPQLFRKMAKEQCIAAVLPRVVRDDETAALLEQLDLLQPLGVKRVLLGNLGQLTLAHSRGLEAAGDFGLNLCNSRAMAQAQALGLSSATASFELTLPQLRDLSKPLSTEILVYGRLPLMLTENCLIKNRTGACACQSGSVKLIDRMGEEFRVVRDGDSCRSVLLNGKKLYLLDKQAELKKLGLWALRLSFTTENPAEVDGVLSAYQSCAPFDPGACTRGLYVRGVD